MAKAAGTDSSNSKPGSGSRSCGPKRLAGAARRIQFGAGVGAVVVIGAAVGITLAATGGGSQNGGSGKSGSGGAALSTLGALKPAPPAGALGPEGVPVPNAAPLAGLSTAATGQTVHGISCQTNEQTLFHIHAHLTVFVNGTARQVPAAIGIPGAQAQNTASGPFIGSGTCFYWLHTHAADGIIHIESPVKRTYTLGDFFAEWGQPLSSSRVGPATGPVTAILNGKVFTGNPSRHPADRARADPAGGGQAAGRAGVDQFPVRPVSGE